MVSFTTSTFTGTASRTMAQRPGSASFSRHSTGASADIRWAIVALTVFFVVCGLVLSRFGCLLLAVWSYGRLAHCHIPLPHPR